MKKYKINLEHTSAKIGEEMVILDHKEGVYFGLNEVASIVLENITESPKSLNDLKEIVLSQFDVEEETVTEDLTEILEHLQENKLIEDFEDA